MSAKSRAQLLKGLAQHHGDIQSMLTDTDLNEDVRAYLQGALKRYGDQYETMIKKELRKTNFNLVMKGYDDMLKAFDAGAARFGDVKAKYEEMIEAVLDGTGKLSGKVSGRYLVKKYMVKKCRLFRKP